MAEVINTNVFDSTKKFVDFSGLDYFWTKAKTYIDGVDTAMQVKVLANETAIKSIQDELNSLSGGAGSIQTQINNAISALDLPNTYEAKGEAAKAEAAAKAYTDGLATKYEAAGAAAQALTDAKSYTDGLNTVMNARVAVLEAIDHNKLAVDASAAAVATILDDAPEAFDTLKEVAEWIAASETAAEAADLVTRVAALEAADVTLESTLKAYADQVEADAIATAKEYTDALYSSIQFASETDIDGIFA